MIEAFTTQTIDEQSMEQTEFSPLWSHIKDYTQGRVNNT